MNIQDILLPTNEYVNEVAAKSIIFLHHTAGGHRPDWVVNDWKNDRNAQGNRIRVATSFVIGGISTTTGDNTYDGQIVRCFPENKWAYHLGVGGDTLNKKSIGIEICNYGPLTFEAGRGYVNYVNKVVPNSLVIELAQPFRGFRFYHRYTDRQLDSVNELVHHLATSFGINLNLGLKVQINANMANSAAAFELNANALNGNAGVWTHTNVRSDKSDCSPQLPLIQLLRGL